MLTKDIYTALFELEQIPEEGGFEMRNKQWIKCTPSEDFNPRSLDSNNKNFYEATIKHWVDMFCNILSMNDPQLYHVFRNRLASKWIKIPSYYLKDFKPVIEKMYERGIREIHQLLLLEFIDYPEYELPYWRFVVKTYGQLANGLYNPDDLFNEEIVDWMKQSVEVYDTVVEAFLNALQSYEIVLHYPLPEQLMDMLAENHSKVMLRYLTQNLRDMFFDKYPAIFLGNLNYIVHDYIARNIDIPVGVINTYYEENLLLPHQIISETSSRSTCDKYLSLLINVNPTVTNNDGRTAEMNYIVKYKELPPQKYLHDPELKDDENKTCQDLWIMHIDRYDIPDEIRIRVYDRLTGGCQHADSYEFVSEGKLYCKDCIKEIDTPSEKVFMSSTCSICYGEYTPNTIFGKYKHCQHVLCEECTKKTTSCPFCAV